MQSSKNLARFHLLVGLISVDNVLGDFVYLSTNRKSPFKGFFWNILCVCLPLSCHFKQVEEYPLKVNSPILKSSSGIPICLRFFQPSKSFKSRLHLKPISGQIIAKV